MADLTNNEIDSALAHGRAVQDRGVLAKAVRFDGERIVVDLANGCTFAFPPSVAQGLETASAEELAAVEMLGAGTGLHWEALDVDLSVPELLAGLFGTASYMARRAGRVCSPRKAEAARTNGTKGGRPRHTPAR